MLSNLDIPPHLIIYTSDFLSRKVGEVALFSTESNFIYTIRFYDESYMDLFLTGIEPDVVNRKDNVLIYFGRFPEFLDDLYSNNIYSFKYLDYFVFSPLHKGLF